MEVQRIPKKMVTVLEPKRLFTVDREKYRQRRVAAYCRVSTDDEEQLTSYNTQKRVYTDMVMANKDWELVGIYADEGISGTRADKRPEFKRMIDDCFAGKIDYIITKSVSRFARNTVDCLDHVRQLKARGIGVYFEEQNIDTLKCDSELYLVIYAGFAQSESESMSKNITWSYRKNFEEEDDSTYIALMKATLGDALGITGNNEEIEFLERRIEALNKRMVQIVSASVQAGESVEHHEDEFRRIADEIDQLKRRIAAAQEKRKENPGEQERLKEIQATIDSRSASINVYDDTIVRQMIECIRVYHDGRLEIIFGGGYEIAEHL